MIENQIRQKVESMGRFREATLERHFSDEEKAFINAFKDSTFKIRLFRSIGYGKCKACGSDTEYVEKIRFYAYCSRDCELGVIRNRRADERVLKDAVARHIAKQKSNAKLIAKAEKKAALERKRAEKARAFIERREQAKKETLRLKEIQIGKPSTTKCKACGKFTPLYMNGNKLFSKKFCDDECKTAFSRKGFETRFEILKSKLSENHEHAGIITDNHHASQHPILFKGCGHTYPVILRNIVHDHSIYGDKCPDCTRWSSSIAQKIIDALENEGIEVKTNVRSILADRKEIDIYLPEHKLGIEVNGIWWHSEIYKPNDYHREKTALAREAGIQLLHFFSDEIENHFDVVMSMILQKIKTSQRIFARKCEVGFIDSKEAREFLDTYHLQGKCQASAYIGLRSEGELVSVMSFRKPISKGYDWEIARYASKAGVTIVGGASKLFSFFESKYGGKILTFSDERYSDGKVYEQLGFKLERTTDPGYFYVIGKERLHRAKFQKHLLEKRGIDVAGKTEREIMNDFSIPRIYDCGHRVWSKNI